MNADALTKTAPLTSKADTAGIDIQICRIDWFVAGETFSIPGAPAEKTELRFSGADLNFAARVVFAEAAGSDQIKNRNERDREKEAILTVLYNRIGRLGFPDRTARKTFRDVASAPRRQFDSVASNTTKFAGSAASSCTTLKSADCRDLTESLEAVRKFTRTGPPTDCNFLFFFAASRAKQGTQIGGNKFW